MRTQRSAQLPLLDIVDDKPREGSRERGNRQRHRSSSQGLPDVERATRAAMARRSPRRGPLSPEMTVKFCNDLLAALDRIEEAKQQVLDLQEHRSAEQLVHLFEAAVRTNDAAASPRRRQGAA